MPLFLFPRKENEEELFIVFNYQAKNIFTSKISKSS